MTKAELVAKTRATRAEWEALLDQLTPLRMTELRTVGDWSIKDVFYHCTRYARSTVDALEAALQYEPIPSEVMDRTPIDERNQLHFQESRKHSLAEALADGPTLLNRLIELTEGHTEAFLIEPQRFNGVPEPVLVWKQLDHIYNHYRGHMEQVQAGVAQSH